MGGSSSTTIAQYGQDTVGGINYVCGAVLLGVEKAANMFGSAFTDRVPGLCSENLEENIGAVRQLLRAVFERQPTQDEFEAIVAFNMYVPPAVHIGLLSRAIDRDAIMQALTVPVLVTQGEKDGLVLASHTEHLLSCIPHAQASVYAGIGHAPPFEEPERFNRELAALPGSTRAEAHRAGSFAPESECRITKMATALWRRHHHQVRPHLERRTPNRALVVAALALQRKHRRRLGVFGSVST